MEVSEIDYFLYKTTAQVLTEKIDDTHVSHHHPIKLKLICTLKGKQVELNQQTRARWDKMNTPKYESKVNTKISKLKNDSINENYSLTQTIEKWKYLMIRPNNALTKESMEKTNLN